MMDMQCEERNCLKEFSTDDGEQHYCSRCGEWFCGTHYELNHFHHDSVRRQRRQQRADWRLLFQR